MNTIFFATNLILYILPLWMGFAIYERYGAEPIAGFALFVYLVFLGVHMATVVKAIIKDEMI